MRDIAQAVLSLAASQKDKDGRHRCPECWPVRRNKTDKPFSITKESTKILFHCFHCEAHGIVPLRSSNPVTYIPSTPFPKVVPMIAPAPALPTEQLGAPLSKSLYWLAKRGITSDTAEKFGLLEDSKFMGDRQHVAVGFPYKSGDSTYAIKWRSIEEKRFTQTGAANSLWLIEHINKGESLICTEGEGDALALWQVGVKAVSIPNGAPASVVNGKVDPREDKKFSYLRAAEEIINAAPKIILAVDNDGPGDALAEEIARRVGRAKCWRVSWPDGCKDAGDVLRVHGAEALKEAIDNAKPYPVKGIYDADHFASQVDDLYATGLGRGESTGFMDVDDIYTVQPGQLCVVTGIPSMGKSAFVDQLMVGLAKRKGWKFAVCSFENEPRVHIAKLCQLYVGKPFFDGPTPRMTDAERKTAMAWVNDHFTFLYQGDGHQSTIDDIIDRLKVAVMRYGIRGACIDPANYVDRPRDMSETDWVSDSLTKIKVFIMAYDLHMWFVAHPYKLRRTEDGKYPVPGGYEISGSSSWFSKTDVGMTVHRPDYGTSEAEIHIWKCRNSHIGKIGKATLDYDVPTGRYSSNIKIAQFPSRVASQPPF